MVHNGTLLYEGSCLLDAAQQRRRHRDRTEVMLGPFLIDVDAGAGDDDDDVQIRAASYQPETADYLMLEISKLNNLTSSHSRGEPAVAIGAVPSYLG